MSDKHKTVSSSAKPIPKVISFQLPEPRRYRPQADRILSRSRAAAANLFQSADAVSIPAYVKPSPESGAFVFTESEFCHLLEGIIVVTGDDGS